MKQSKYVSEQYMRDGILFKEIVISYKHGIDSFIFIEKQHIITGGIL